MHIEGGIAIGEGAAYAGRASARLNSHPWPMIISLVATLAAMAAVMVVSAILNGVFDWQDWTYFVSLIVAAVVGIMSGKRACRAFSLRVVRKALAVRGLVDPVPNRFEITPAGLHSVTGRVETRAPWIAVSDVFSVGPYWVLIVDAWPMYLPKRFFGSPVEEKAFLGTVLSHITPEARARSADAVRFANS